MKFSESGAFSLKWGWATNRMTSILFHNSKRNCTFFQEANHKPSFGRSVLSTALILISLNRIAEAEKINREYGSQCTNEQSSAICHLIRGCEKDDGSTVSFAKIFFTVKFKSYTTHITKRECTITKPACLQI